MAHSKDLNPYDSPQTFYGAELRRVREHAGFSQDRLGERVFCSGAYIGQIESAIRRPQLDLSQRMDTVLETGGHLERLCRMVLKATKHAEYFADVVDLLAKASGICQFSGQVIPGLLQTEAYCQALFRASDPLRLEEKVREMVSTRLERAVLLEHPTTPQLWFALQETVLRLPVCDRKGMHGQLLHILEVARTRRAVVQVIPDEVGAHPLLGSEVTLMTFLDAPPAVYVEAALSGHLLDSPAMVTRYTQAYDFVRALALSPEASLSLIESVAKEYIAS
ncbi:MULTISPECIES: helix-turn-helix domain-containing protein [unclassified Streptomyces]|uniref:helix-turn-helix domain-containing protein n=1 Tax=unclassified Streptomyces TaxID=2593676 RepID=UPI002E2D296E|nr:helix-turn-helix transcriptional regulator [Streptomyces sp. NBC_00223]